MCPARLNITVLGASHTAPCKQQRSVRAARHGPHTADGGMSTRSCFFATQGQRRLKLCELLHHGCMPIYTTLGAHPIVPGAQ